MTLFRAISFTKKVRIYFARQTSIIFDSSCLVCYEMSSHLIKKGTFRNNKICAENLSEKELVHFCTKLVQKFANGAKIRQILIWKREVFLSFLILSRRATSQPTQNLPSKTFLQTIWRDRFHAPKAALEKTVLYGVISGSCRKCRAGFLSRIQKTSRLPEEIGGGQQKRDEKFPPARN
jgi:hypothetical protein